MRDILNDDENSGKLNLFIYTLLKNEGISSEKYLSDKNNNNTIKKPYKKQNNIIDNSIDNSLIPNICCTPSKLIESKLSDDLDNNREKKS